MARQTGGGLQHMAVLRRPSTRSVGRGFSLAIAAATGASVLAIAPAAYAAAPHITAVSPAANVGLGAGQNGHPARQIVITVSNVAASDPVTITFPSYTGLTASVTNVAAGSVTANVSTSATSAASSGFNLTLTDSAAGGGSDTTAFAIIAPPVLTSVSQPRVLVGTSPSETLTGTGLQSGVVASAPGASGVTFGAVSGVNAQGTTGTVTANVANNAPGGAVAVTLSNPDGGWSTTNGAMSVDTFVVSSIAPTTASNADSNSALPVTVTGQGIPSGSTTLHLTPTFNVTGQDPIVASGTTAANGQSWSGTVNLAAAAPGAYQVQLVNGSNTGTLSSNFTVTAVGAPTVTTVTPSSIGAGNDATLTIAGTNFAKGATVTFSKTGFTVTGAITYTSSTSMTVPIHVASNAATGAANATSLTVTNTGPAPNSGTKVAAITVPAPPTITSVAPSTLGQGAATTLTITGTGFQSGATVTFATGITATGTATVTSTQIKIAVKVASNSPNKVDVTVKNPDNGTVKSTLTINAFTVTSVTPHYVPTNFSGTLTVNGSGFQNGATVTFPTGSGVAVQNNKTSTVAANGNSLTVPINVNRTTPLLVDVTVTNTTTDLGSATCTGCLGVAVAPTAPANVVATKTGTTGTVHWDAVVSPNDGGAPITGYTVTVTSPANSGIPAQSLNSSTTTASYSNLDANTDYVFAVTATNAANLTSAPSSATTSRKTTLTLGARQSRTISGQADQLSGRLLDVFGKPIVGATVMVHRQSDTGVTGIVATLTTDAGGNWSTIPKPLTNTTYTATFAGNATNDASSSASVRVIVAAKVSIRGVISATSKMITITGHVSPNKAGRTVRLVGYDRNGVLHHFGSAVLDSNSHYRFKIKLPTGRWRFQVRISQTVGNGQGQSANLVAQG